MKTYIIPVIKTVSGYVMIDAENKAEAIKIANTMLNIDDEMQVSDSDIDVLADEITED